MEDTPKKVCRLCGIERPLDRFYYRNDSGRYRSECKECFIELVKYREYGVCKIKYEEMLVKQHGVCGICKCTLNASRYTKFCIDHNHKTNKVRGLLCEHCNTALGLMRDSPIRLLAAIEYLKRHGCEDIV